MHGRGAVSKSADQFKLTITGEMAHGATPHHGVDAIAAALVNEVQKVVSREMPVAAGAVITIGTIHGGEATNIICPSVVMQGTTRTCSQECRALLSKRMRELAEGVAPGPRRGIRNKSRVSIRPATAPDCVKPPRATWSSVLTL
ncbi:peptidase dimerization domain-containing protein [Bradyrhizobium sp. Ghvi]|uniref:peptidase dimerization domain-containing protein n=1 Tax=Bradyrhizobium sp. Ghvi TaxID=1855319 RepID=UPI001FCCE493|nr:peptidase dimerization domain-containing protein [Bradyrhizobium sp. Ghvi]